MNTTTWTIAIALAGFILSIFTANWLALRHTDRLVDQLDKRIGEQGKSFDGRILEMEKRLLEQSRHFEARLLEMGKRFDAKLEAIALEIRHVSDRLERIERQLDAILKPVLPKGN